MKKGILIVLFFFGALFFSTKNAKAQGTFSCTYNASTGICELTSTNPRPPGYVGCDTGYHEDVSVCSKFNNDFLRCRAQTGACLSNVTNPLPSDVRCSTNGKVQNGINTAIGCVPFTSSTDLISFILKWSLGIVGGIAFLLILVAGFQIMTSRGDPNRLKAGQELLTSAIAGLVLLIFSVFILRVIGFNILNIPAFGGK